MRSGQMGLGPTAAIFQRTRRVDSKHERLEAGRYSFDRELPGVWRTLNRHPA